MKIRADYEKRMADFGVNSRAEVQAACDTPGVEFLDVRSEAEVGVQPLPRAYVHAAVTPEGDVAKVTGFGSMMLENKQNTIVVFCDTGKRAAFAKNALEGIGYTKVINAGGLNDLMVSGAVHL
jgi:rhodanese-related sulfurtransferase